jgi:hypothetical protein
MVPCQGKFLWSLKKLSIKLPYNAAIPLLRIYRKDLKAITSKYLYANVYCSLIHNA